MATVATLMIVAAAHPAARSNGELDRKSTRLNSSHLVISYAVFCLKKNSESHIGDAGRRGCAGDRDRALVVSGALAPQVDAGAAAEATRARRRPLEDQSNPHT